MATSYYTVKERRTIAETPDLRVVRMVFAEGECIPWHYHTKVTDTTFCLEGEIVVELREPEERVSLKPGQHIEIPRGRPHRVGGPGERVSLIIQGVGKYDFIPIV